MTNGEPDYDIFENSEDYFQNETLINLSDHSHNANFCYVSENSDFLSNSYLLNLCKNFVIFLEKLQDKYANDTTKYSKYREYLNFWLTYKLTATGKPNDYISKFYEFIQNNYEAFPQDGELKRKIYHIKGMRFNNMSILYELYKLYYEIKVKSQEKCPNFREKFIEYYNLALQKCYFDDENLCNPLEKFKRFYDQNRSERLPLCSIQGLPILPNFVTPKPLDKINFKDKIAYHLSKLSKKQNEETHSNISNTLYPNLVKFLSFNYNMLLYSDKKEKRDNMMKILYEFIKFCNESNTITFPDSLIERFSKSLYNKQISRVPIINSFIKEFFENYYKHNEYEYGEIYEACSTNKSSPLSASYCTVYDKCNQVLGTDLFKIKDNIQEYLEYKETRAQELSAQSSKETLFQIKEDDSVSSNTTPINVGVGVGALFTLSFLYKFTPIGSLVNRTFLNRGNSMHNYDEENGHYFLDHNADSHNYLPQNGGINMGYNAA
ncbi:PIR Superfamily Protein [Plasmodium ovale curtisi]|uniref:PIR Superfamily Protein n=1 Tax=Plasmodium ovale curtisi TaxID=864141 RepID=A0A1A8WVI7_PLAOA|nr:PIR Superfamily Protein [Plasmodium ovale curtisi]